MKQRDTPCKECPFRRDIAPGTLGGSPATTYIGQVNGQFWLPCHCSTNYSDPNWKTDLSKPQCAGAAIFRANVGVRVAPSLLVLPQNNRTVFNSFEGFLAHHEDISWADAQDRLAKYPPSYWTATEYQRAGTVLHVIPKEQ
jgi:hypothetical protein